MFARGVAASLITLAWLLAPVVPAGAQLLDTPWPAYMHDVQHTGRTTVLGPSTGPVGVKWTPYKLANVPKSQPAIGPDGTVYIGVTHQPLCAIDGTTGVLKWCTGATADGNSSSPAVTAPIPGQPIAHAWGIYVGARDNALWAVNDDGTTAWRNKIQLDGDVMSPPTVAPDGTIYMTCGCLSAGIIWATNPDGTVRWSIQIPNNINNSSVTFSNDTPPGVVRRLYVGSNNGSLWAVDDLGGANVSVAWSLTPNNVKGTNYNSSPAVDKNGHIYWGSAKGFFKARDDGNHGTLLWSKTTAGTVDTTAAIDNDSEKVVVSSFKTGTRTLYAFDFSGNLLWTPFSGPATAVANHQQAPSAVMDAAGNVYAGIGKRVYAFDAAGNSLWSYLLAGDTVSMALGEGTLYVSDEVKFVYALVSP